MKNRPKLVLLIILAATLVGINLIRPFSSRLDTTQATVGTTGAPSSSIPDAEFDTALLEPEGRVSAEEVRRNIFEYGRVTEQRTPSPTPPRTQQTSSSTAPPPPPPKPPLQFFGFAEGGGQNTQRVFLTDGENIFVARQGDLVMERFRVARVDDDSVQIEDTQSSSKWVLPLQQP